MQNHQESNIQIAFQLDVLKRRMKELGYVFQEKGDENTPISEIWQKAKDEFYGNEQSSVRLSGDRRTV